MTCGVGHRHGSDPTWLWRRPASVAPIRPLAWEPPYATGVGLKKKNKNKTLESSGRILIHQGNPELIITIAINDSKARREEMSLLAF